MIVISKFIIKDNPEIAFLIDFLINLYSILMFLDWVIYIFLYYIFISKYLNNMTICLVPFELFLLVIENNW